MLNQHSHALILSNYEACGLITFRVLPPRAEDAMTLKPLHTDDSQTSQYHHHQVAAEPFAASPDQFHLDSSPSTPPFPPPHLFSQDQLHNRTETSSTIVTEILAPQSSPSTSEDAKEKSEPHANRKSDHGSSETIESRPNGQDQARTSSNYNSRGVMATVDESDHANLDDHDTPPLPSPRRWSTTQGRLSSDTAIYTPEVFLTPPQTADGQPPNEDSTLDYFQRPPSPPLTPEWPSSSSLDPALPLSKGKAAQTVSTSKPIEETQGLGILNSLPTPVIPSKPMQPLSDASRPKPSSEIAPISHASPVASRSSSGSNPDFLRFDSSHFQAPLPPNESLIPASEQTTDTEVKMPTELIFSESSSKSSAESDDIDLPALLASRIDYNALPWEDSKYNKALPSALRRPISASTSVRSSFDSAAPPPISLGRFPGYQPDQGRPEFKRPQVQPPPVKKKLQISKSYMSMPKSLSSIFHSRSHSPFSIAYQDTTPGNPPVEVSVLQTSVPSIPTFFPKYKGPWPPEESPAAEKVTKTRLKSMGRTTLKPFLILSASKKGVLQGDSVKSGPSTNSQQHGPAPFASTTILTKDISGGPAPLAQPFPQVQSKSNDPIVSDSKRPATAAGETTQRRKSWFNADNSGRSGEKEEVKEGTNRERRRSDIAPGLM